MKIADIIILGLAIAINVFMFAHTRDERFADQAYIQVGNHDAIEITLADNRIIDIDGLIGKTRLQIHDGAVRFLESPCRHKICIRQGWLRHGGESGACLPNGLSIRLRGGSKRFDSTSF